MSHFWSRWVSVAAGLTIFVSAASCAQGTPPLAVEDAGVEQAQEPTAPPPPAPTVAPEPVKPDPRDPDEAAAPDAFSVTPDKGVVGGVGPSIVFVGDNFVKRSVVQLDGAPLATTFVSATELRATIPSSKLTAVGTLRLSVGTGPPGGGASKELTFEVQNPTPSLTALAPLGALMGSGPVSLHCTGSAFVRGAKVSMGATELTTTFTSDTALEATVPAALLASAGSFPIKVENPAPGGGASSSIAFTVVNPDAVLQSIAPDVGYVGGAGFALTVNGGGFVPASVVSFNGVALATTWVSSSKLTATVPAARLAAAGSFPITVQNPPPGGGVSAPLVFRVEYPVPTTASLSPSRVSAGAAPTPVTVTGTGFYPASQVTFDGVAAATTYVDPTHVRATLTAAELATAGGILVRVTNPAPGGGMSGAITFTVDNPAPSISSLGPASVTAGSPDTALVVNGAGFVAGSVVKANGASLATTFVSASKLGATVPSALLTYPGSVSITVTNGAPGGGTSAPKSLVVGCDTSGVDVPLGSIGALSTLATSFAAAPQMSRFESAGLCTEVLINTANQQPGRFWVVQNTSGVPFTLSAWADCTADGKQGDAYLTFYRRPTVPANDADRLGCANVVSEGLNGIGGYSSPERGLSEWCPGLTKANGGGLALGVCEKAVVHIQPWSFTSTTYTPPPTVRIKAE